MKQDFLYQNDSSFLFKLYLGRQLQNAHVMRVYGECGGQDTCMLVMELLSLGLVSVSRDN